MDNVHVVRLGVHYDYFGASLLGGFLYIKKRGVRPALRITSQLVVVAPPLLPVIKAFEKYEKNYDD